ncbi:hypothetical protein HK099_004113 [Clydaea vesicula]|uniref:Uncharacterized protein n=1 Tax=Clydaea vesicula TaxID=447962 RepID=A0AAD5Y0G5_9FUNG|nr:hypothetical protein HK099_004113 [Clydaea vesicula]KAJ3392990.1 hypothetical protein HDU92_008069 [Lobulomyces angularis]
MTYFSHDDIAGLKKYKYSGVDKSILSNKLLNPYWWTNLVKIFPLWFAPNLVTLTGFFFVLTNLSTLLYLQPHLNQPLDNFYYYTFAFGLFAYQSLDAIDGKQARRTGTSGPLGELFDHGCDALNTGILVFLVCSAIDLGQGWEMVVMFISGLANFYLTTWEEYHTGTLFLSFISGPVEGILLICVVFIVSGMYSPSFWSVNKIYDFPLNQFLMLCGIFVVGFNIFTSVGNVKQSKLAKKEYNLKFLLGLVPFIIFSLTILIWLNLSPTLLKVHLVKFLAGMTLLFGYQVGLIILSHICKRKHFPYISVPFMVASVIGLSFTAYLKFLRMENRNIHPALMLKDNVEENFLYLEDWLLTDYVKFLILIALP